MRGGATVPCRAAMRWPVPASVRRAAVRPLQQSCSLHGACRRPFSGAAGLAHSSHAARVLGVLEATRRDDLAYSELEELCEKRLGLDGRAAAEATAELHRSGRLAHFAGTSAAGTVFLRPERSSEIVASALAPAVAKGTTPDRVLMRLKEIDLRYRPLKHQRDMVVREAHRSLSLSLSLSL